VKKMSKRRSRLVQDIESLPEEALPLLEAFIATLKAKLARASKAKPVKLGGILKDYPISDEEIAQARREMWGRVDRPR
jgi:hypothetical protein